MVTATGNLNSKECFGFTAFANADYFSNVPSSSKPLSKVSSPMEGSFSKENTSARLDLTSKNDKRLKYIIRSDKLC